MKQKDIDKIMEWCFKNNSVPMHELYNPEELVKQMGEKGKEIYENYKKIKLCSLDGGWVNLIQLNNFLKGERNK